MWCSGSSDSKTTEELFILAHNFGQTGIERLQTRPRPYFVGRVRCAIAVKVRIVYTLVVVFECDVTRG
jgi:hypothetical protein